VSGDAPGPARRPVRVMVVDDSEVGARVVAETLETEPDVEVVARARDGEAALAEAHRVRPDAICLDLEMPRMDGFTFLRLLMARLPTPVIVVTGRGSKADVFRALELGALDFVVRPNGAGGLQEFRDELLARIRMVRALRLDSLERRAASAPAEDAAAPAWLAVIGASTGGPPALQRVLGALPPGLSLGVLVAQHMPERFTRTFAERLGRATPLDVSEAEDRDAVEAGRVLVAPGGRHLTVERVPGGGLQVRVLPPAEVAGRRYCPSIDLLFESAARAFGDRTCGVVLTGMGSDGRRGIESIKAAGGLTLAESEDSAVVYGMPEEAIATGRVDEVLPLDRMAERLARFARGG
jgi:two-component system chemotaxis response regulator CheB